MARMTPDIKANRAAPSNGTQAQASAWAPNPQKSPFYFDLPFDAEGKAMPLVAEKWTANSPLVTVDQNVTALKSFRRYRAGCAATQDGLQAGNKQFSTRRLRGSACQHSYEVYEGTHGNSIGARFIDKVLPFFAKHLTVEIGAVTRRRLRGRGTLHQQAPRRVGEVRFLPRRTALTRPRLIASTDAPNAAIPGRFTTK